MDLEQLKFAKQEDWDAFEERFPEAAHFINRQALYREWLSLRIEKAQPLSQDRALYAKTRLAQLDPIFAKPKIYTK